MSIDWDKRQGTLGKHRHLADDILDDTGESAIGAAQTVSLLGPFPVAWNSTDVEDVPGFKIVDLDAGAVIIKTWIVVAASWEGIVNGCLIMRVTDTDGSPGIDTAAWSLGGSTATGGGTTLRSSGTWNVDYGPGTEERTVSKDGGGPTALYARLAYDSGTPSSGSADIYALIATPS